MYSCNLPIAAEPDGLGPNATCLATCANARFPSNPPVFSAGGASSPPCFAPVDCDAAVAVLVTAASLLPSALALHPASTTAHTNTVSNLEGKAIQRASAAAASSRSFFRTTMADTAMPTKYNPIIGAMKINMVIASGVGVITAATTAIIKIA